MTDKTHSPLPRVAVITPYFKESLDVLKRAHDSVRNQTYSCTHYMVADGHARDEIDAWDTRHIRLPLSHGNNGNTPRAIGSLDAMGDDFDAIAYLDADNWFDNDHIENLIATSGTTGASIVTSGRIIHGLDGEVLMPDGEAGDGETQSDTSTMLITRRAFGLVPVWSLMPKEMGPNCDRLFFQAASRLKLQHHHSPKRTLHFTSRYHLHYRVAGKPIPTNADGMHGMKESDDFARLMRKLGCTDLLDSQAIKDAIESRKATPVILIVIGEEEKIPNEYRAMLDSLEQEFGSHIEIYFSSLTEILDERDVSQTHRNVFCLIFESLIDNQEDAFRTAEDRPDIKIMYMREESVNQSTVDSPLDRRAHTVFVRQETERETYKSFCRYGDGHVVTINDANPFSDLCELIRANSV